VPSISLIRRKLQGYVGQGTFERPDLRFALANQSEWSGLFREAKLGSSDFTRSKFTNLEFLDCQGELASFGGSIFDHVDFAGCKLGASSFVGSIFRRVNFFDCDLQYVNFAGVTVRTAHFERCNLHGADLDFIENNSCGFHDCNIWGAKVSLGCQFFNSAFDERTTDRFVAMVARVHPDPEKRAILEGVAGRELPVVKRLMDRREPEDGSWPTEAKQDELS